MNKENVQIQQRGMGTGAGEYVNVLSKEKILEILDNLSDSEICVMAIENQNPGFQDGHAAINLETGEFYGFGMSSNTSNHACDNNYVILHCVNQNDDFDFTYKCGENIGQFVDDYLLHDMKRGVKTAKKMLENDDSYCEVAEYLQKLNPRLYTELADEFEENVRENFEPYYPLNRDEILDAINELYSAQLELVS